MREEMERIERAAAFLRDRVPVIPRVCLVLGSGLGDYAERMERAAVIPYGEIPGFPEPTVPGHAGKLHVGLLHGVPAAFMQGRFHYYEGHDIADVVFPVRVLRRLGADTLLLTTAAGGINADFRPGDLMAIEDHLNFTGVNPLRGRNLDDLGPRFPDMSQCWTKELRELLLEAGERAGVPLRRGVYAYMTGPSFESPAEIRALRTMGADAVGMSTVPEAIAARHAGMRVAGISCVSNMAAGMLDQPLTHEEVLETGERVKGAFQRLLDEVFRLLAR